MPATRALLLAGLIGGTGAVVRRMPYDPMKRLWKPLPDNQLPENCTKPEEGEKVVYMIVHGEAEQTIDGELTPMGVAQAEDLRDSKFLRLALSEDSEYRAEAVIVPPLRRAMQTAVVAFNETLPQALWEFNHDIKGPVTNNTRRQAGMDTIKLYKPALQSKLKAAYKRMEETEEVDHFARFVSYLKNRTEKNLVVVATRHEALLSGANVGEGEVAVLALKMNQTTGGQTGSSAFHKLSLPGQWKYCTALFEGNSLSADDWYKATFTNDPGAREDFENFRIVAKQQEHDPRLQWGNKKN